MESGVADLQKKKDGLEVDFGAAEVEDEAHVVPYFRLSQLLVRVPQFSLVLPVFLLFLVVRIQELPILSIKANTGRAYTFD